ncbi:MAG: hypothetical protein MJ247_06885 [Alphaproteobacteria bacterium]|nr:hypothetical protein [Alphaproteobacteria bacterium]
MGELSNIFAGKDATTIGIEKAQEVDYPYVEPSSKERVSQLLAVLGMTKQGKELINDAKEFGVKIMTDNIRAHGSFDDETNVVKLNCTGSFDRQLATLSHELRHAQQFKNGVQMNALKDRPEDYLHSQWLIEADANVSACIATWELKQMGINGPYDSLMKDDKHILEPFTKEAEKGGIETGDAQRAAFEGWFKDTGIRGCYDANYLRNFEYRKRNATKEEREEQFTRAVPIEDQVKKVCNVQGKSYMSGEQAKEFFSRPDINNVSDNTYWAIYRNLRDVRHFEFLAQAKDVMEKEAGGLGNRGADYWEVAHNTKLNPRQKVEPRKPMTQLTSLLALKNKTR